MILFELFGSEYKPEYQALEISNGDRQYSFLQSIVLAAIAVQRPFISQTVIKALNFHAITCLHVSAGEFRPCQVTVDTHIPPEHYRVQALMDDFSNEVNRYWETSDPVFLAAFVLWKLNWIHPFINGNGRTSRAACYFILCVKLGAWLPGNPILPQLIVQNRPKYIEALKAADASLQTGSLNLSLLHALLSELLSQQIASAQPDTNLNDSASRSTE